jgi:hypothetical protein
MKMQINSKEFRVRPGEKVRLSERPTIVKPFCESKKEYQELLAAMSSAVMEVLDTSVVNVSLPHIAGNISAPAHMGVSPHLSIPDFPGLRSRSGSLGS